MTATTILGLTLSMEEIDRQSRLQDNIQEDRRRIAEQKSVVMTKGTAKDEAVQLDFYL